MTLTKQNDTATDALALLDRLQQLNRDYIEAIAMARREAIIRTLDQRFEREVSR